MSDKTCKYIHIYNTYVYHLYELINVVAVVAAENILEIIRRLLVIQAGITLTI